LNISSKELIVVEIITPLKISTGVDSRALCQLEELDQIHLVPFGDILRPLAFATGTGRAKELARWLPKPPSELRREKIAKWHKRDHALLSLG
jgi:hypothetical protein